MAARGSHARRESYVHLLEVKEEIGGERHSSTEPVRPLPQLPLQSHILLGRETELNLLRRCLVEDRMRLVTIAGPPGVGKTRLALEAAILMQDAFQDGTVLVEFETIGDPDAVPQIIAEALGLQGSADLPSLQQVIRYLGQRSMLLVLDGCERVMDAAGALVEIVMACPGVAFLLTCQEPLRVSWEHALPLAPLPQPDLAALPATEELALEPAILLFVQRARAIRLDFALTDENAADVAAICARLDGMPLAIELAAARTNLLPPAAIRAMLDTHCEILNQAGLDLPRRHRSLQAALEWGYQQLSEGDQALLRQLSVFAGGFRAEAAIQLVGGPDEEIQALDGLGSLAEKSFLVSDPSPSGEPRFRLLETIRRFGAAEAGKRGELQALRARHAAYYTRLAEQCEADAHGPRQRIALDRLEEEQENLRVAFEWAREQGDAETAVRLACALAPFWWIRGHLREGTRWIQEAVAAYPHVARPLRARALVALSALLRWQGMYDRAVEIGEQALQVAGATEDPELVAWALTILGAALTGQGRFEEAHRRLEAALEQWKQTDNARGAALALRRRAMCALDGGQLELAQTLCADSMSIFLSLGDAHNLALSSLIRAQIAVRQGDLQEAVSLLDRSLELMEELGEHRLMHVATEIIIGLAVGRHESRRVAHLLGAAEAFRALTGFAPNATERGIVAAALADLQAQLDPPTLEAARREGRAMPLEAIMAEARELLDAVRPAPAAAKSARSDLLSKREHEVLELVAMGHSNKAISRELFISENTVKYHVTSLLNKLGASSRAQTVALAIQRDLL